MALFSSTGAGTYASRIRLGRKLTAADVRVWDGEGAGQGLSAVETAGQAMMGGGLMAALTAGPAGAAETSIMPAIGV
ncbi:MAG: hypothetical protein WCK47_07405 [bacterium]|nr:hypothetical protein [Candidatus Sumerlaeota bacterium]